MPVIECNYTKKGVTIEVNGAHGPDCLQLTAKMLEHHAGEDGGRITTSLKPEYADNTYCENMVDATKLCG